MGGDIGKNIGLQLFAQVITPLTRQCVSKTMDLVRGFRIVSSRM